MLIEETLFGKVDKVQIAIDRIRQFEPEEGYYVAFSGGKDSCVILDLVKRAEVKYDAHYNLTTVDPPELVQFIRKYHPNVERHLPKETMWQLIARKGDLPMRKSRWCCQILKEGGGSGRTVITGIRWEESVRRSKRKMVEACNKEAKHFLHPIIDWTSNDIWQYIKDYAKIPYCSLYNEGYKRLGCVLCPMVHDVSKEIVRFPKIIQAYKNACSKGFEVMKERKERNSGIPITWENSDDWFNWWVYKRDGRIKQDPDQTVMFE
ncbi:MAG TPA: phosphoadenosine phosphosulfate reductase family protein [Negativicutes bacterium]|jgi:phosphoadenosine phosphosulfate reductase